VDKISSNKDSGFGDLPDLEEKAKASKAQA